MMKDGYRCAKCGVFSDKGSKVYIAKGDNDVFFPFCTLNCAKLFKSKLIQKLEDKIEKIKNEDIEEDIW